MHSLILIERYLPSSFFWSNLLKNKKIEELSVEEILYKYKGFEGELIAFFSILKNEPELANIIKKCLIEKKSDKYIMLHIISDNTVPPPLLREQASLVGYDVGVCEEEKTIYSSIFNEILFGHLEELISFKTVLNENLLFPDKVLAEKYINVHNSLSAQGKGVEDYEKMIVYEVWKQNDYL